MFGNNLPKDISDFELVKSNQSLFDDMKACTQDPVKHAEGDVFIHTQLVYESLVQIPEFDAFSEEDKEILVLTALFHDICKPHTRTVEPDGSISHPNHAKRGAQLTRQILDKHGYAFQTIYKVYQTIMFHGYPFWAFAKDNSQKSVILTSLLANNRHLHVFGKADLGGRICLDSEEWAYRLDYFEELCRENNCYNMSYPFYADYDRFNYFQKEDNYPDTQLYPEYSFEITMLCGLPAVGKDSYIREHIGSSLPIVSMDLIREQLKIKPTDNQGVIIQAAKEQSREYCRKKQSFIWNATNLTKQVRSSLISIWLPYKPKIRILFLHKNINQIIKDNAQRERKYPISSKKIEEMHTRLEFPDIREAHEVLFLER